MRLFYVMKIFLITLIFALILISPQVFSTEHQAVKSVISGKHSLLLEKVKASAEATQQSCMRFVQMNVFEFEECISEKLKPKSLNPSQRLGITYMGFIGALSAQRMGSQGSQMMAWKYGKSYQKIQKRLQLNDLELCQIVPGDCETRIARTKSILEGPPPKALTEMELADQHRH